MVQGRLREAVDVMEGSVICGSTEGFWKGAALDSRKIRGGELFFALPGERTDGHLFVPKALQAGAAAAIVQGDIEALETGTAIRVDDSLAALHRLTRAVRARAPEHLVAITGSIGKTTTKEILAALLARQFRVARSPGNLNNLFGFPIALLGIPERTEWMVAEMGMSTPGELSQVSRLGRPDVAVLTNIRPVHLEFFGSLQAIAEAKAEILDGLAPDGFVVANADDPEIVRIVQRFQGRVVWTSCERQADYCAMEIHALGDRRIGSRFLLRAGSEEQWIELPLHGRYNVGNCLVAAACAHQLGVPLREIAAATNDIEEPPMRGIVHRLDSHILVIDDSYNSNPAALREALASALDLGGRRYWAVLGDMLELGDTAPQLHREAGRAAADRGFSPVIGVGALARHLVEGARETGVETDWYPDARTAARDIAQIVGPGDVVLVKGSRGVGLEVVVAALIEYLGGED